jgi:hypothetical protein
MKPFPSRSIWQAYAIVSLILSAFAFYQTLQHTTALQVALFRSKWIFLLAGYLINILVMAWIVSLLRGERGRRLFDFFDRKLSGWFGKLIGLGALIGHVVLIVILYNRFLLAETFPQLAPTLWMVWWLMLFSAIGLRAFLGWGWDVAQGFALVLQGALFILITRAAAVSSDPFSLGWSEASRYYYGSLFFAQKVYGVNAAWPVMHPSRYLLQSIPFIFSGISVWGQRLWQVILWITLTAASAWALARRLRLADLKIAALIGLWFFVYAFQGAVYYHLEVGVIIVLIGVSKDHPWRSLIAVILASLWAGISRVNWFPVPAMLAIALHLIERPVSADVKLKRYLLPPVAWSVIGIASAFGAQAVYIALSGNTNLKAFGSSFTSDLIWARLLPNVSFPLGVIPAISLVALPLALIVFQIAREGKVNWHWIRPLGLSAMLIVLLIGGLIVSVKIGGGADLHNMDAFMILLAWLGVFLLTGKAALEDARGQWQSPHWFVVLALFAVPMIFALQALTFPADYDHDKSQQALKSLNKILSELPPNSEVLFVGERQLLATGLVKNVRLVPDYEVVTLMEMAMSRNRDYLDTFYNDLHRHRFAIIVARKFNLGIKENEPFAEENNAWNTYISPYVLCEYEPVETLAWANVQIHVPRAAPKDCPTP